ncbi:MAG TPA: hypothetical protein VLW17_09005, partial [Thermoanaerobaculaceae bacterium]|nr:hypothetical protein [Thermoanaerobaculaceae bacterium]
FDPAGGLLFSAPFALLALAGTAGRWRRAGAGEKAMLVGALATVLALLNSGEWYGGGSPPARYLVPLLPAFALCGAALLAVPRSWRRSGIVLLPPSLLVWWTLVSRPQFSINSGDGGWWLADCLARRFGADARHLCPSFLRPCPATLWVPLGVGAAVGLAVLALRGRPARSRALARATTAAWLAALAAVVVVLTQRYDAVVEIEDPQVQRHGGTIEPPEGTFARSTYPNGWRVGDGEGVRVPLHLPPGARVRLEGWLEGAARRGVALRVAWDAAEERDVGIPANSRGSVVLPPPGTASSHHTLDLTLAAPQGGSAVLDRLVVER